MKRHKEREIICEIGGGLGNQMFCYACGLAAAKHIGGEFLLDASAYYYKPGRKYGLKEFAIQAGCADLSRQTYVDKVIRKLKLLPYHKVTAQNHIADIQEISASTPKERHVFLDYEWHNQNYLFFHEYRSEIRQHLSYTGKLSENYWKIQEDNQQYCTIAVHLRYGDYVGLGCVLDPAYYGQAIDLLKERTADAGKQIRLVVFSEDMETAQKIIGNCTAGMDVFYVTRECGLTDLEEFWLMKNCDHFVISNSTFSWWAAYLGEKQDSSVAAPIVRNWISNCWEESYFPDNWMTIEAGTEKR